MRKHVLLLSILAIAYRSHANLDIEDREQTDPLLKIQTWDAGLIPEVDDLFKKIDPTSAEIQRDRTPQSYKNLWGKSDVFMIHPVSVSKPGFIDFSEVTANGKGDLKIYIKNHPWGNHDIKLKLDGAIVENESIHKGKWEFFKVKFNHQPVVLEIHATQWQWENSFITYKIEK